jgi:DNA mismatch repair protein MutL
VVEPSDRAPNRGFIGRRTLGSGDETRGETARGGRVTDIHQLDRDTVQRIAAGEVVERPASAVKELVENSLDADASRVSVAVESGGKDGIRVRDDGIGMRREQLELAVEEHTTSKISDIADLEAGVGTLGFRGEALSTIGAVSRLTIRSKPRGASGAGTELRMDGGEVVDVAPAGCPEGTTVEVADLFFNTPAREKFLKTDATEFDHVNTVVTQYALANPDVAVSLEHDDREVFATEGRGSLESTVLSVYGREVAEAMHRVDADPPAGAVHSVTGLVSHPETTRASRDYCSTFVNGRYVRASVLRDAILDAYGGQLAPDRFPFAVLFVEVPPESVDVNVHPRKMEVRFDDEAGVKAGVESAVEDALLDAGLVRSSAPRGRSAPAETQLRPETGGWDDSTGTGNQSPDDGTTNDTASSVAGDSDSASTGDSESTSARDASADTWAGESPESSPTESTAATRAETTRGSTTTGSATEEGSHERTGGSDAVAGARSSDTADTAPASDTADTSPSSDTASTDSPDASSDDAARRFRDTTGQRTLTGADARPAADYDTLPNLRVLGQYDDTYLVCESDDGLLLVDQHAADERVNYERLQDAMAGDTPTQALAEPVTLELTAREAELFAEYTDALAQVGFHAGRTGDRTVEVRTVPAVFGDALDPDLLRDVLSAFVADGVEEAATVDAVADALLADLACYPSITGNTSLHEGSMTGLLSALDDCQNPFACPHGRPTVVRFDRREIEDRFERDYPGHAGRRRED